MIEIEISAEQLRKKLNIKDGVDGKDGKDGKDGASPDPIIVVEEASRIAVERIKTIIPTIVQPIIKTIKTGPDINISRTPPKDPKKGDLWLRTF